MGKVSRARRLAWYAVVVLVSALVGATVATSGRPRALEPGEAEAAEVLRAVRELREMMQAAGEADRQTQLEIDSAVHELRCKYLPETTEGCNDDDESGEAQEKRQAKDQEP